MCLAIPAQIVQLSGAEALVEVQGVRRQVIVSLIPDPRPGDYVLLHAGFAIRKWSPSDVKEFYATLNGTAPEPQKDHEDVSS